MISTTVRGLFGFATLSTIYLLSLFLYYFFSIPLPPALIGIFILLLLLALFRNVPAFINLSARPLLAHMGLFLISALVSVLHYGDLFSQYYLALIIAVVLSTILSLFITLFISQRILINARGKAINDEHRHEKK